jgi:hypothetical protein
MPLDPELKHPNRNPWENPLIAAVNYYRKLKSFFCCARRWRVNEDSPE